MDAVDLLGEIITQVSVGGEWADPVIIYTPVYELIIEPHYLPDGSQDGIEYTINKYNEVSDA